MATIRESLQLATISQDESSKAILVQTYADTLCTDPITATDASATIQSLLTAGDSELKAGVKSVLLIPSADIYFAVGKAATVNANKIPANASLRLSINALTDLRILGSASSVPCIVIQEG